MYKMFSCVLRAGRVGFRVITGLSVLAVMAPASYAIGPKGPLGPSGPIGVDGGVQPSVDATSKTAPELPAAQKAPGAPGTGNRIEVTGNTASNVRCADGASVAVNSVDVEGGKLDGRTVIVQGRNVQDVDCPPAKDGGANAAGVRAQPPSQVNSIKIR